jgi:hypothetical protein
MAEDSIDFSLMLLVGQSDDRCHRNGFPFLDWKQITVHANQSMIFCIDVNLFHETALNCFEITFLRR